MSCEVSLHPVPSVEVFSPQPLELKRDWKQKSCVQMFDAKDLDRIQLSSDIGWFYSHFRSGGGGVPQETMRDPVTTFILRHIKEFPRQFVTENGLHPWGWVSVFVECLCDGSFVCTYIVEHCSWRVYKWWKPLHTWRIWCCQKVGPHCCPLP